MLSDSVEGSAEVARTSGSSQTAPAHSPTDPSVLESVNTDSMNVDSAISSPGSWVDGDFGGAPEKLCESTSDGSLCDSGTAWEVHRAIPVEITTLDEGPFPSTEGGLVDERYSQSCVDEGVYSMSSLESSREQAPEPVSQSQFQKAPTDPAGGREEADGPQVGARLLSKDDVSEQESCSRSSQGDRVLAAEGTTTIPTFSTGPATPDCGAEESPSGGSNEAVDRNGDLQDQDQESKPPAEDPAKGKDVDSGEEGAEGKHEDVPLEETAGTRLETREGLLREHLDPQYLADQGRAPPEPLAPGASPAVPLITVSTEPEMPDQEDRDPGRPDPASPVEPHQSGAVASTGGDTYPSSSPGDSEDPGQASEIGAPADPEGERWDERDANDLGPLSAAEPALRAGQGGVAQGHESPLALETRPAHGDSQRDPVPEHMFSVGTPGPAAGRGFPQMDFFQADLDESSPTDDLGGDPLEPMDLFYPDKDEPVYSEPPEGGEAQAWPSVLRVSPLQPAPASKRCDDGPSELLSHAFSERKDTSRDTSKVGSTRVHDEQCH